MTQEDAYSRTRILYGQCGIDTLKQSHVAVFGLGGVGGSAAEALARAGIGTLDLIDSDKVTESNLNRQILALHSTIGRYKVDVAKERIADIDPSIQVHCFQTFFLPETAKEFDFTQYDYVIDAIDTVTGKIEIIMQSKTCGVPVISAMGCGNRIHPQELTVTDLFCTSEDPLAKVMRRELKRRGIQNLKVVWSREKPVPPHDESCHDTHSSRRPIPGSVSFVPPAAGMMLASEVVNDLVKTK